MNASIFSTVMACFWLLLRLRRAFLESQSEEESIKDVLKNIESKLDQLISNKKAFTPTSKDECE